MRQIATLITGLLLAIGCSRPPPAEEPSGSARFAISMHQALTEADVARVEVTVEAFDISPNTIPLTREGTVWKGTMSRIRAGANRRFLAEAFDSNDVKIYEGEATGVTITADETVQVRILAQQVNRPPPFANEAPIIESLVISSPTALPNGTVTLQASARDPNPGDTPRLTYAWTATGGTFADATNRATSWTAPATQGSYTLTLTVTDPHGATATVSFTLRVEVVGTGNADIEVRFNSWPEVATVVATPSRVQVGQTLSVSVTASDPETEASALNYSWAASCTGTWTNGSSATAQFTPTAQPGSATCNNCELTVTVTDSSGGVNTGKLAICVGNLAQPSFPPQIASVYQSSQTVIQGNVVRLRVNATDSRSRPLQFDWSANMGLLGTPAVNNGTTGEVLWTAPACLRSGATPSVSVRIYAADTPTLYSDHTFTFSWGATGRLCSGANGDLCFDADNDYLGRWSFDTTYQDASVWANHLTEPSTPLPFLTPGVWGDAAQAQGGYLAARATDDDELDFGTSDFTVALWVNLASSHDSWLLSKAADYGQTGGWSLRSYYGQLHFYSAEGNFNATRSFSAGAWHHVAVVRGGGQLRFYVDGVQDSAHSFTAALTPTSSPLVVGARGNRVSHPLYGLLDELIILDRAATPLELASLAQRSCR